MNIHHDSPAEASAFPAEGGGFSRIVPLIVATALLMENIDASVLATSLPEIARDIGPIRFTSSWH